MSCAATGQVFTKDPDATLDYTWDWTAWLGDDTISTAVFTADPGIVIEYDSVAPKTATVWLSGGTAYQTYQVICKITTAAQRIEDRSIKIFCAHH